MQTTINPNDASTIQGGFSILKIFTLITMKTRMIAITGETHFTNSKIDSTMSPKPLGGSSGTV